MEACVAPLICLVEISHERSKASATSFPRTQKKVIRLRKLADELNEVSALSLTDTSKLTNIITLLNFTEACDKAIQEDAASNIMGSALPWRSGLQSRRLEKKAAPRAVGVQSWGLANIQLSGLSSLEREVRCVIS
jgi:hypothetical protein